MWSSCQTPRKHSNFTTMQTPSQLQPYRHVSSIHSGCMKSRYSAFLHNYINIKHCLKSICAYHTVMKWWVHFFKLFLLLLTFRFTKHSAWFYFGKPCEVCAYIWWRFYLKLANLMAKPCDSTGMNREQCPDKWITYLVGTHKGCVLKLGNWQAFCLY